MHDTTASEAAHRLFVKKVMSRVRKGTDYDTASSSVDWVFRTRTWAKIIDEVQEQSPKQRRRKKVRTMQVVVNSSKELVPTEPFISETGQPSFSPLRTGGDRLLCNNVRLSYDELGQLVSSYTGWDRDFVDDVVQVQLHCSAVRCGPGRERRTFWGTDRRYQYQGGSRRDTVEVEWVDTTTTPPTTKIGCAQITAFITMSGGVGRTAEGVIVRWMDKSSLSTNTDSKGRPVCDYPLSFNHCLWQWSKTDVDRRCFRSRGFRNRVTRAHLWSHVDDRIRSDVIREEIRARYDIIAYDSIVCHVNIHKDPSTGHLLQTLQIV